MILKIVHTTRYAYDPPAQKVGFRLRLFPASFEGQRVLDWTVRANGELVVPLVSDGFGDDEALWLHHAVTHEVEFVAQGTVETEDRAGVVRGLPKSPPPAMFHRDTLLTRANDAIRDLAESVDGDNPLAKVHNLSDTINDIIAYRSDVTASATTAAEALAQGEGVCQDHAHVLISAARAIGLPARYIVGYLLAGDGDDPEVRSHAWAEVHIADLGWVGFDPSNRTCPTDRYVRLNCGLDANAAAPIRGTTVGGVAERLEVSVSVEVQSGQSQLQQ